MEEGRDVGDFPEEDRRLCPLPQEAIYSQCDLRQALHGFHEVGQ